MPPVTTKLASWILDVEKKYFFLTSFYKRLQQGHPFDLDEIWDTDGSAHAGIPIHAIDDVGCADIAQVPVSQVRQIYRRVIQHGEDRPLTHIIAHTHDKPGT